MSVDSLRVSLCLLTCFSEGQGVSDLQCHGWAWWAMRLSKPEMDNQQLGLKENRNVARSSLVVAQSCLTLCNPMNYSTLGFPVFHYLLEFAQTHIHWVSNAIQPSHPLSSPSSPALNLSQHQGLFKWVSSSHQVAKVLEFQLQHQFFQWIFKTDFL